MNPERAWALEIEFPWCKPTILGYGGRERGYEFRDGWGWVYEQFCRKVAILPLDEEFSVSQAKQKFGALVIYCDGHYGEPWQRQLEKFIKEAYELSLKTCEKCGGCAELRHGRVTLCDGCYAKWNNGELEQQQN